ncbi:unnamed protein product, partial [Rotaria sordida]
MFLRKIDNEKSNINFEKIHNDYEDFRKKIIDDYEKECVIKNPYYHIIIGNDLIINDFSLDSKYDQAMKHFDQAIELDSDHCAAAFVGRGWLLLKGKERTLFSNELCVNYKDDAIRSFQRALELLSEEMALLTSMQTLLQQRCTNKSVGKLCDIRLILSDHVHCHKNAIENREEIAIVKDDNSQFRVIYKQKENEKLSEWIVNDPEMNDRLIHLVYNGVIIDRTHYWTICNRIYKEVSSRNGFIQLDYLAFLQTPPNKRKYEVTFNDLTTREDCGTRDQAIETIDWGFDDELVNIDFDELEEETAKTLIQQIRKKKLDFSLTFKNLEYGQIENLIDTASVDQEDIKINKVNLRELFMKELRPDLELAEFSGRGIEYLVEVSEKNFIPWFSISSVAGLAVVQMAVGGILIASGFGSTVGMGLITESVVDLFIAYQAYSKRQFSWSDYGKQKAVSLIISGISMGISAIKDGCKGAKTVMTAIGQEALEQAGTKIVTNGSAAGQVLVETGKNITQRAIKKIGLTVISDTVTGEVWRIAESHLMSSWSSYGTDMLSTAISEKAELYLNDDEKQNLD